MKNDEILSTYIFVIAIIAALFFSLTSCGKNEKTDSSSTTSEEKPTETSKESPVEQPKTTSESDNSSDNYLDNTGGYKGIRPDYSTVAYGYLEAFGDEVSIGEVFDVVSGGSADWSASYLDPKEKNHKTHFLVESSWYNDNNQEVVIQFLVNGSGKDFQLHGASVGGKFMNALSVIMGIKQTWVELGGELEDR